MKSADYNDSVEHLKIADQLQSDARAELLLAIAYRHMKQMDMASRYLALAMKHSPDNPEIQRSMAGYYRDSGDYAKAITALKSDPQSQTRRDGGAGLHLSIGWST